MTCNPVYKKRKRKYLYTCSYCAEFCHEGHDILYIGEIKFYCNCGVFMYGESMLANKCLTLE